MGYVLRDGKRYYQDGAGNLTLDNVSQEEADRREVQSARVPPHHVRSQTGFSPSVLLVLGVLVIALVMLIGAFVHNQRYESPAEKAINDYMNRTDGTVVSSSEIPD